MPNRTTSAAADEKGPKLSLLPNGLQVLVQEDCRFPLAVMRMYIRAGSAFEGPEEAGISHLLEHMAFKGSKRRTAGQAALDIESVGGEVNAATGFDHTVYMVELPANHWQLGLEILQDLCFDPLLDEEEFSKEKEVVLAELERNEDNPKRGLFELLQKSLWSGTEYARPVIGSRQTVKDMSSRDVRRYVERLYQPQSMLLVVCGNVEAGEVLDKAQSVFSGYSNDRKLSSVQPFGSPANKGLDSRISVEQTSWNKVYASFGFPVPGLTSIYASAIEVLTYLLGGDRTSALYTRYKYEMGLVDDIGVTPVLLERGGMILVQATLDASNLLTFLSECLQDLFSMRGESFTEKELSRAKLNIEDGLFQTKETLAGLASKLGYFQFFEKDLWAEERYQHNLAHLQLQDIQEALDLFVQPEGLHAALLIPEEAALAREDIAAHMPRCADNRTGDSQKSRPDACSNQPIGQDLAHGCRMVSIPDDTMPYLALDLSWPGGDLLLGPEEQGMASLAAKALTRGTKRRSVSEIREFLAERAAYLDAQCGRDQFSVVAKFPKRFTEDILDLVEEILCEPAFDPEEVDKCISDQKGYILERKDHPLGLLSREVFPFLFKDHPYAFYHLGDESRLERFTPNDLGAYWQRQQAYPWVLSVCGQAEQGDLEGLGSRLASFVTPSTSPFEMPIRWSSQQSLHLSASHRNQAHILVLFSLPGLGHPSNVTSALLKRILAGQGGILFQELRDRQGLGYAVAPMLWHSPLAGFLGFYIGTDPERADQALQSFKDIVSDLGQSPASPADLERAQNLLQAEYYRDRQSLISRSSEASDLHIYGLPLDYQEKMISEAWRTGVEDIRSLAQRYLDWDKAYSIILSPE